MAEGRISLYTCREVAGFWEHLKVGRTGLLQDRG